MPPGKKHIGRPTVIGPSELDTLRHLVEDDGKPPRPRNRTLPTPYADPQHDVTRHATTSVKAAQLRHAQHHHKTDTAQRTPPHKQPAAAASPQIRGIRWIFRHC